MNAVFLVGGSIVIFIVAYIAYGGYLLRKWGVDPSRPTPAKRLEDGVDYVPAPAPVLLGHHFSSIAGAGPIVGPIGAAMFGWVPVILWIIVGSIFFGGVHDMGALFASIRSDGKSLGEVIGENLGSRGKRLFAIFAWLTLILVVAAFTNVVASTFVASPEAATSSLLFIVLAIGFGFFVYRKGVSLTIGSIIGVSLLFISIYIGMLYPLTLDKNIWMILLLIYITIASITPVWILLQPRDYLNSFLLYAMLVGGFAGIMIMAPEIKGAPVAGFEIKGLYLFPMLFVMVACGAVSGFHSLVGSGTTSKQLSSEKDVRLVGYGSMLIEGVLAAIALVTATYVSQGDFANLLKAGGPIHVFSTGLGNFMTSFGLPFDAGKNFTALAISAFALTSLDTATRLARFIFQEMFTPDNDKKSDPLFSALSNRYVATLITVVLGGALAFNGWKSIWPIFGSANQLLAAIALLAIALWLKNSGKGYKTAFLPMIFMFCVTLTALSMLIYKNLSNIVLLSFSIALTLLALVLIFEAAKSLSDATTD